MTHPPQGKDLIVLPCLTLQLLLCSPPITYQQFQPVLPRSLPQASKELLLLPLRCFPSSHLTILTPTEIKVKPLLSAPRKCLYFLHQPLPHYPTVALSVSGYEPQFYKGKDSLRLLHGFIFKIKFVPDTQQVPNTYIFVL